MKSSGVTSGLKRSLAVAILCVIALPPLTTWASGEWNGAVVGFAMLLLVPSIVCTVVTIRQQQRGTAPSFAPLPLTFSTVLAVLAALSLGALGLVGAALDLLLVPLVGMFLAVAWVQPRPTHAAVTAMLGFALVALVAWFAGRADEYWSEAVISGTLIALTSTALWQLRTRGTLSADMRC